MKKIFSKLLLFLFLCSGCGTTYYQLIELDSDIIKSNDKTLIASNNDLNIIFNFWSNGGSTNFSLINKSDETIYIKHDECQLIINGESMDYYDNSKYTKTKSILNEKKGSKTYVTESKIYGKKQTKYNTVTSSTAVYSSNAKTSEEKLVFVLHPNSYKNISGFNIQDYIFSNCDVDEHPNNSNSNLDNGLSFTSDDSPLKIRLIVTYSFDEDFKNKLKYEADAFVSRFSNWNGKRFIQKELFYQCEEGTQNRGYGTMRYVTDNYSPFRYYKKYNKYPKTILVE